MMNKKAIAGYDKVKAVRWLSWLFFVPFLPYAAYTILTYNSIGGLLQLALGPVFAYLVLAGLVYLIVLIDYAFSSYPNQRQQVASFLVIVCLVALLIARVIPLFL
jgi:hypothetical protein